MIFKKCCFHLQKTKLDEIFSRAVDELHVESNLYKKIDYLNFITKIIEMHGIDCVKKTIYKDVIHDAIDMCSSEGIAVLLLPHVLEVSCLIFCQDIFFYDVEESELMIINNI